MEDTAGDRPWGTSPDAWAVPGSTEAQPVPVDTPPAGWGTGDGAGGAGDGRAAAPGGGTVPHLALRPMTVADVLDGGFTVLKARPLRLVALTAAFVVPANLLATLASRQVAAGNVGMGDVFSGDPAVLDGTDSLAPAYLALILVAVVTSLSLVCVAAAVAHEVSQWMMGRDAAAGELFGVVGRRIVPLAVSMVLVKVAEIAGILGCYVGILFVMTLFVVVAPVVAVEGCGPFAALGRSVSLVRGRFFPVMGVAVLMGIVGTVLTYALGALPEGIALALDSDDAWPLVLVGEIVASLVVVPFTAAATALLYLDLRVRNEGLDIEMSAIDLLDRPA
ncbi:MAG TPA: hypothetical protein VFI47_21965 [Acidimicrobiales bacterium]|nr:hypothetical protein [Acidimicrobiales bacterium]